MRSKVVSLSEAAGMVKDGDTIGVGTFTLIRPPMALLREVVRRGTKNLTFVGVNCGPTADLLIGAGCLREIQSPYVGFEIFGQAPNFRRAIEGKRVKIIESSEISLSSGLRATIMGLPYLPCTSLLGSDILKVRQDLKVIRSPFAGEYVVAVPPVKLDVAIIHGHRSDPAGNVQVFSTPALDLELALAAEKVVVSVEEIVSQEMIMRDPRATLIQSCYVDAIVLVPFGAHPYSCFPYYTLDPDRVFEYLEAANDEKHFAQYLDKCVYGVDHQGYCELIGADRLSSLKCLL